jgi:hypothetical protein
MSLDLYLMEPVYSCNITHNLTTMAKAAGIYDQLWRPEEHDIWYAGDLIVTLRAGIKAMESSPTYYKTFDSSNGWGVYEDFLPWLKELLAACEANPDARVEVSV